MCSRASIKVWVQAMSAPTTRSGVGSDAASTAQPQRSGATRTLEAAAEQPCASPDAPPCAAADWPSLAKPLASALSAGSGSSHGRSVRNTCRHKPTVEAVGGPLLRAVGRRRQQPSSGGQGSNNRAATVASSHSRMVASAVARRHGSSEEEPPFGPERSTLQPRRASSMPATPQPAPMSMATEALARGGFSLSRACASCSVAGQICRLNPMVEAQSVHSRWERL